MNTKFNRVSVIGLGYIGLPTAAMFANYGIDVIGVDTNESVVATINKGEIHIVEPDLNAVVHHVVNNLKLRASLFPENADVFIIAVPTPFKDQHVPDLSHVKAATESIAPFLQPGNLVILESTSPVGTTNLVEAWIKAIRPELRMPCDHGGDADIQIAYCPERVLPGHVMKELIENDRVVGGQTPYCAAQAVALYSIFLKGRCLLTTARTAEMAKLTENAFRDVNIAFANELSLICNNLNINVWELIKLTNCHPRVNILQPGPGVGGHCISVDPWFIVHSDPENSRLIRCAREVNDSKPNFIFEEIQRVAQQFDKPIFACLGLAFKANVDDLRESPSISIVQKLAELNIGRILVVEPYITKIPSPLSVYPNVELMSVEQALPLSNVVVLLVNHDDFINIDREMLTGKVMIDTRGIWQ